MNISWNIFAFYIQAVFQISLDFLVIVIRLLLVHAFFSNLLIQVIVFYQLPGTHLQDYQAPKRPSLCENAQL